MNAFSIPADEAQDVQSTSRPDPIARFLRAPFHARSFTNLLYLLLAFPLGTAYFIFLTTGLSLGTGLVITLLGLPIVGLTMLASWWLAALERRMAIGLLGAEVPPMGPTPFQSGKGFRHDIQEFLSNRVTWTGMLYLVLKFPLGIFSFVVTVTLIAFSTSFLLVPFLYPLSLIEWDGILLWVDSPAEAGLCFVLGLLLTYVSLHLLNGLAAFWKMLSVWMLGSEQPAAPAPPAPAPAEPEAPAEAV